MNPIEQVRERLDGGRWWKGSLLGPGDTVCLVGALNDVTGYTATKCEADRTPVYDAIRVIVGEQYPDRLRGLDPPRIAAFNDHPDTTWADVELVLDKASIAWDEAVR